MLALLQFEIYDLENRQLKVRTDNVWIEISHHLNKKLNPVNLFTIVDMDRNNVASEYRRKRNIPDDCLKSIDILDDNDENDDNDDDPAEDGGIENDQMNPENEKIYSVDKKNL